MESAYRLDGGRYGFTLPEGYDRSRPLVIDPSLAYSTFIGGAERRRRRRRSPSTGRATPTSPAIRTRRPASRRPSAPTTRASTSHPVAATTCFVAKLNPSGTALVYSTFLGGRRTTSPKGSRSTVKATRTSPASRTRRLASRRPPAPYDTHFNGVEDAFVTKLNPSGTALVVLDVPGRRLRRRGRWHRRRQPGQRLRHRATPRSNGFPTTAGAYDTGQNGDFDGFVAKLSPSGATLTYSTLLGEPGRRLPQGDRDRRAGQCVRHRRSCSPPTGFPTTAGAYDTSPQRRLRRVRDQAQPVRQRR